MLNDNKIPRNFVLIDGNAIMYRAYYGVNKNFVPTLDGMPVGMVYGFSSILLNIIEFLNPANLVITFDCKEKTFRHDMDEDYKAHRKPAPDDFYPQMPYIEEMVEAFQIPSFKMPGFESDDLIGSLATKFAGNSNLDQIYIVSGDLDFTQLVSDKIKLLKVTGKISDSPIYGPAEVMARYGVEVCQMVDFKAITGDSSDNYSGIPGLGPKTAEKLLDKFDSIEGILDNLETVEPVKLREKFRENKDYLLHCQKLAAIKTDIEVDYEISREFDLNVDSIDKFFEKMGFRALRGRLQRMNKDSVQGFKSVQKSSSKKDTSEDQMSLF
jgi:DNA polymerase-1